jgi:hypothetical protein
MDDRRGGPTQSELSLGVDAVQLRRADQGIDRSGPLTTGGGAGEQVVVPAQNDGALGAFGSIIVDPMRPSLM